MLRTQSIINKQVRNNAIATQKMIKDFSNLKEKTFKIALPDIERLNPMRKVTEKINFKDELHPLEPLKNLRHEKPTHTKVLRVAVGGNGKDPDDLDKFLNNLNKLDVYKKYEKTLLETNAEKISKYLKKDI